MENQVEEKNFKENTNIATSNKADKKNFFFTDGKMNPAIAMSIRLSAWIAFPIIIASLLGDYLDNKYNKAPWYLLVCVGIAFIISMFGLITNTLKEYEKIAKEERKNKSSQEKKNEIISKKNENNS